MKASDFLALLPGRMTFLLLPREVVAVRSVHLFGRTLGCRAWSFPCDGEDALPSALAQARGVTRSGHELSHVGLPLETLTLVHFTLPLGAREDLPSAVRYALMRHVPFPLDNMRWQYAAREQGESLNVTATLISEARLAGIVEVFSRAGIGVASVFPACAALLGLIPEGGVAAVVQGDQQDVLVWNGSMVCWQARRAQDETPPLHRAAAMLDNYGIGSRRAAVIGDPPGDLPDNLDIDRVLPEQLCLDFSRRFSIDVVSSEALRNVRRLRYAVVVPALVLLATLALLPFRDLIVWQKRMHQLEQRIEALRTEAGDLAEVRQRNTETRARIERWEEIFSQNVQVTSVLREITRVIPRGAWLESLQIQERRAVLSGNAPSATVILEQLENSPFFEDVRFDAPVTRQGALEKFRIVANISKQ